MGSDEGGRGRTRGAHALRSKGARRDDGGGWEVVEGLVSGFCACRPLCAGVDLVSSNSEDRRSCGFIGPIEPELGAPFQRMLGAFVRLAEPRR